MSTAPRYNPSQPTIPERPVTRFRPLLWVHLMFVFAIVGTVVGYIVGNQDSQATIEIVAMQIMAVALVSLPSITPQLIKWILISLWSSAGVQVALVGVSWFLNAGVGTGFPRVAGIGENSNLIGAGMAIAVIAACTVIRNPRGLLFILVGLLMIYATGSRTAITALLLSGIFAVLLQPQWRNVVKLITMVGVLIVGILLLFAAITPLFGGRHLTSPNLLRQSDNLQSAVWNSEHASFIAINLSALKGPSPDSHVFHVRAVPDKELGTAPRLLVQGIERSRLGSPYVASVYLMSNRRQIIGLSSNLADTLCEVEDTWRRCSTVATLGNGVGQVQFQLFAPDGVEEVDILIANPQVEVGWYPSPAVSTRAPSWLMHWQDFYRFRLAPAIDDFRAEPNITQRMSAWSLAWSQFKANPWFGHRESNLAGNSCYGDSCTDLTADATGEPLHAHNLLLHSLATHGIAGALSIFLPLMVSAFILLRISTSQALPMLICIFMLNLTDVTYIHGLSFYPIWATFGILIARAGTGARSVDTSSSL